MSVLENVLECDTSLILYKIDMYVVQMRWA